MSVKIKEIRDTIKKYRYRNFAGQSKKTGNAAHAIWTTINSTCRDENLLIGVRRLGKVDRHTLEGSERYRGNVRPLDTDHTLCCNYINLKQQSSGKSIESYVIESKA